MKQILMKVNEKQYRIREGITIIGNTPISNIQIPLKEQFKLVYEQNILWIHPLGQIFRWNGFGECQSLQEGKDYEIDLTTGEKHILIGDVVITFEFRKIQNIKINVVKKPKLEEEPPIVKKNIIEQQKSKSKQNQRLKFLNLQNYIIQLNGEYKLKCSNFRIDEEDYFKLLKMGVSIDNDNYNLLVMKNYNRTFNLLLALCQGKPIISSQWITDSINVGKVQNPYLYILKSNVVNLQRSIELSMTQKIFKDQMFHISPTLKSRLEKDQICQLIEAGGGKIKESSQSKKVVSESCEGIDLYDFELIMNQKLWVPISQDMKLNEKPILSQEFSKANGKKRILIGHNSYILMSKTNEGNPKKYLKLDFETKFEIIRTQIQQKNEEDDTLGEIIGITFMRDYGNDNLPQYKLVGNQKIIKQWREYLYTRVNQWQFHHMFRVFKKIGRGNFASVYMAERIEDGQQMAIKAFSKQAAYAEDHGKEAIVNELTIMRKLNNSHLMNMYEIYETQNSLYVALELLEGGSLYDLVKEHTILSIKQIQQILVGILLGLLHMHQQEIMHRDIKLENILFKQPKKMDTVVIADFGLATHINEPVYLYCRCGTPGYVAPEVINIKDMKGHYSSVCDIYSLGLVFYLLISGKPAFPGKSYTTVVKQNREATIDFTIKQLQNVPPVALDLLKKMLEKDPNKRITCKLCLEHPFLNEMFQIMTEDNQNDFIEEGEDNDLSSRMTQLNEESAKFDAFRRNQLINSPQSSPGVLATKQLKQQKQIDSQNQLQMNSPVLTGKTDTIDSIPNVGIPPKQRQSFQASPMIKPSRFKNSQQQQQENPLLKYTQKKE